MPMVTEEEKRRLRNVVLKALVSEADLDGLVTVSCADLARRAGCGKSVVHNIILEFEAANTLCVTRNLNNVLHIQLPEELL